VPLTGEQVLEQYKSFEPVTFGTTTSKKRKQLDEILDGTTGGRRVFSLIFLTGIHCLYTII
jgi:hypothetical protein